VDGTYELFRHYYAWPSLVNSQREEIAATRGVVESIIGILESGITHIGVATDHVIHSFRNEMWPGYKTDEGVPPNLLSQFPLLEESLEALGLVVWPMVELEADDAIAGAAKSVGKLKGMDRVVICSPDKDFAQLIQGDHIVQFDRRKQLFRNEAGVVKRFGVHPKSIPDWLALVGDTADGYPGLEGWGEKSASTVLASYGHLEDIPLSSTEWKVKPRSADRLASTLQENFKLALLFRDLATLRIREPSISSLKQLYWTGPRPAFGEICKRLDAAGLVEKVAKLAATSKGRSKKSSGRK
jgi:5'-3' exonuclease